MSRCLCKICTPSVDRVSRSFDGRIDYIDLRSNRSLIIDMIIQSTTQHYVRLVFSARFIMLAVMEVIVWIVDGTD